MTLSDITVLLTGDFLPTYSDSSFYSKKLEDILAKKDYSITNLEAPFTLSSSGISKNGNNLKVDPDTVRQIVEGHFDAVSLSNNHIRDFGDKGVMDSINTCRTHGIETMGAGCNLEEAGKPHLIEIRNSRICFLNYSEIEYNMAASDRAGANPYDPIKAYYDIRREKSKNDFVVVIYHGGVDYQHFPSIEMVRNFRFMIDNGADAVIGHHSHCYSGITYYNDKPLVYGLGNFFFKTNAEMPTSWFNGLLCRLSLKPGKVKAEAIPIQIRNDYTSVDILEGERKDRVITHMQEISSIIEDEKELEKYWKQKDRADKEKYLNLIRASNKLEYRILKRLPEILKPRLSSFRKNLLLNMLRCESHRTRATRILENENK